MPAQTSENQGSENQQKISIPSPSIETEEGGAPKEDSMREWQKQVNTRMSETGQKLPPPRLAQESRPSPQKTTIPPPAAGFLKKHAFAVAFGGSVGGAAGILELINLISK